MTQVLNGGPGNDSLTGTDPGAPGNPDGIDIINGFDGDDTLNGLDGDDIIQGGLGADVMNGGAGFDTLTFADATAGVGVALNAFGTFGEAVGDTMTGFEALIGSAFNDQLAGDSGNNVVDGGDGDDYIQVSGGVDTLIGGAGRDILDGRVAGAGINVDLTAGTGSGGGMAAGTTLSGFELVLGSAFDDVQTANLNLGTDLVGLDGADTLNGANGDDQLFGDDYASIVVTGGADTLNGGGGNDRLEGGAFGDVLNGGAGVDTIVYSSSASGVTINLATGAASGGEAQGDTLIDVENVVGSAHADRLTGAADANRLNGGGGDDILAGLVGADTLDGGAGIDTADYSASAAGVTIDLGLGTASGGDAAGDTLIGIENVTGSASADDLTGAAGVNILSGGAGNDVLAGLDGADTLDGGGGSDTADYTASTAGIIISLQAGTAAGGHAEGDTLTSIENLTGSAFDDTLTGAADANRLTGGAGNDILAGLGGADTLDGGAGIDTADYSASAAGVTIDLGLGTASGGDAAGDTLIGIENLTGSSFGDTLTGTNGGANSLSGGAGNDMLAGLGGADTLDGGGGSDTADYTASTAGIIISLQAGTAAGGHAEGDTLTGIENLTGSSFDDTLTGTDADANTLAGGAGNDILDGLGGGDTLTGGAGNDIYYVDAAGDQIVELANEGMDLVRASLDWILADNVEWLELQGTAALSGTGNALDNIILGNSGDNLLVGGAGDDLLNGVAGADTAAGGTGNDRYHVDDAGDIIVENAAEGTADRVYASVSYQLAAGAEVEVLNTRTPAATTGIDLTGNEFGQTIIGNAGANIIDGRGGIDTMKGLGGNDVYHVDNSGDIVIERSPEGTADQVMTSVDYTLGHGVGIEILSAADAAGTAAIQLTGNSYANTITGNAGDNVINGGRGQDTLTGLGGSDTFVFNAALIAQNVDHITDFNAGDDIIQLDHAIFTALTALGTLAASAFVANASGYAESADNRLIYETDTGKLIYDSNGSAAGERHLFATLDTNLAITAADFFVV
jgi:Ca2+-binding RTX toxin-like protein